MIGVDLIKPATENTRQIRSAELGTGQATIVISVGRAKLLFTFLFQLFTSRLQQRRAVATRRKGRGRRRLGAQQGQQNWQNERTTSAHRQEPAIGANAIFDDLLPA